MLVVVDHKPLCKILGDKAMEDITNSRIFKLKERTLLWKFLIVYRPGKVNYFADCTSRNPVETSGDNESSDDDYDDDLRSKVSAVFQSKLHTLTSITFDLVESALKDNETIQSVISQLVNTFPEDKSEVCAELREF